MVTNKMYLSIYKFLITELLFNKDIYTKYACTLCFEFYKVSYKTKRNETHKLLFKVCLNDTCLSLIMIGSFFNNLHLDKYRSKLMPNCISTFLIKIVLLTMNF